MSLKDKLTFLIAVKIEHEDRKRNTIISLEYLRHHFDADIIVCEQDTSSKLHNICKNLKCRHLYFETDEFFNRQRGVNLAAREATTPVIAHYDACLLYTSPSPRDRG